MTDLTELKKVIEWLERKAPLNPAVGHAAAILRAVVEADEATVERVARVIDPRLFELVDSGPDTPLRTFAEAAHRVMARARLVLAELAKLGVEG
jgi:hypothetical protein